jgi:phosphopantothenoylcysteine decarboxylase / phosphopantothenate---cysteine ligase
MSRILLGVCGGIAAYKAAALTSFLVQRGDDVDVIMTQEAQRFVGALTFSALTQRPVYTSLWDAPERIPHIRLTRDSDVLVVMPATANAIAKMAQGIADDLLTNAALAARTPIVIAPAMNEAMYEHSATAENLRRLRARGCEIVEPGVGFLAEREVGIGRLAEQEAIIYAIDAVLQRTRDLVGERVVVTAGPTRERIDPVRFLSNASTGTMGIEVAREALARGATVDLILGPTLLEPPLGVRVVHVVCAQEMYEATLPAAQGADIVVASAAVADWRPVRTFSQKVKKSEVDPTLRLERTPDILARLGDQKRNAFLVGFAAETQSAEQHAREKLHGKHLDAIAVNDVSEDGTGFGIGETTLTVLWGEQGRAVLSRSSKREVARKLWDVLLDVRKRGG